MTSLSAVLKLLTTRIQSITAMPNSATKPIAAEIEKDVQVSASASTPTMIAIGIELSASSPSRVLPKLANSRPTMISKLRIRDRPNFPLWDEMEAAACLDPSIITRRGRLSMDVDLMPGANYGALLTWGAGKGPALGEREVEVVYAVDPARLKAMFVERIRR